MRESLSQTLQKSAKYLIFAGVLASFVFIAWRIATKGEYERCEFAQCEALAISAAFAACGATNDAELSSYIREHGKTTFIIDHMKMPGHNVVSVEIEARGENFLVTAKAETSWNSRSPQSCEFVVKKSSDGLTFSQDNATAKAFLALAGLKTNQEATRLTFTFPYERECPVPFDVIAASQSGLYKTPLTVLRLAKP